MAEQPSTVSEDSALVSPAVILQIEKVCQEFEESWQRGRPDASAFLVRVPPEGQAILRGELAAIEDHYVKQAGQSTVTRYDRKPLNRSPQKNAYFAAKRRQVHDMASGQTVGKYELEGVLGKGGMGKVYKARDTSLKRTVALKVILAGVHADERDLSRFKSEAEAIARLRHPNIVQIYEVGEHDGMPFISLEFCGAGSLDKKLDGTPLPPKEAAQLIETLARAMFVAHKAQVIHRDLKPANILLQDADSQTDTVAELKPDNPDLRALVPKITDFGLAKMLDDAGQTHSGAIMGTPSYMAPEQAEGKSKLLGPGADIYALGAVLYQLLTGRPPFKAANPMDTIKQVITDEPVAPRALQPKVPIDLETVCLKCLQKEPGKRYGTAQDLADDLGRFLRGEPVRARPVSAPERFWRWCRRNPRVAILGVGVFVVVALWAVTATFLSWRLSDEIYQKDKKTLEAIGNQKKAEGNQKKAEINAAVALGQFAKLGINLQGRLLADDLFPDADSELRRKVYDALFAALVDVGEQTAKSFNEETSEFAYVAFRQQMGDVYKKLGKSKAAWAQFQNGYGRAKAIAKKMENRPESDKARGNWGMMASRIGDSLLELEGDAPFARRAYEQGRKSQQDVFSDPKSEEYDEVTNKDLLAHHDMALGAFELQVGRPAAARMRFQEAVDFRAAWAKSEHAEAAVEQDRAQSRLGEAYLRLGITAWHLADGDGARRAFEESLRICHGLLGAYKDAFWYRIDLAEILAGRAEAEVHLGKRDEGRQSYRDAEKNLREAMPHVLHEPAHKFLLGDILEGLASTARGRDQLMEAKKQYAEVLKIRKELVAIDPDNLIWRAAYILALAHAGQVEDAAKQADGFQKKAAKSPALMLQAARSHAVCAAVSTNPEQKKRHLTSALDALRTATAGDFEDAVALRTDRDFDSLKTEPDFIALVDEVAQRAGKR